jgi:PAS domain S-box-containing protein
MLLVEADGTVLYANARACELFGYEVAELVGRGVELLVPESFRSVHRDRRAAYNQSPTPRPMGVGLDLRAQRADGTTFPAEISLSPMDVKGRRLTLAAVRDVSSQRMAEERFRRTVESSPVGIAVLERNGRCVTVNPALCRITGYDEQQLREESFSELLTDDLDRTVSPEGPVERRLLRADGTEAWVEVSCRVLDDEATVLHVYDVTERRRQRSGAGGTRTQGSADRLPTRTHGLGGASRRG